MRTFCKFYRAAQKRLFVLSLPTCGILSIIPGSHSDLKVNPAEKKDHRPSGKRFSEIQWLSDFNIYLHHGGVPETQMTGPHTHSFCFSRSGVRLMNLCFSPVLRWSRCCGDPTGSTGVWLKSVLEPEVSFTPC